MWTGGELLEVAFGILREAGATSQDTVEVDVEFLELSSISLDVHRLLPPPFVHFVFLRDSLLPSNLAGDCRV